MNKVDIRRKCCICKKPVVMHEHYKIAWIEESPIYLCSQKCYIEYCKKGIKKGDI